MRQLCAFEIVKPRRVGNGFAASQLRAPTYHVAAIVHDPTPLIICADLELLDWVLGMRTRASLPPKISNACSATARSTRRIDAPKDCQDTA
jgi:hypothetical protein